MSCSDTSVGALAGAGGFDESVLIAGLRAGDAKAFESLVRIFGGSLLATTRRLLRNEADAQDALQDALLSAFRAMGSFEETARLATWLHRIAVNAALMKLRSRKPEESIKHFLPVFDEEGHTIHSASEWGEPADDALARGQLRDLVRRSIDKLPDSYRVVLILQDIEGLESNETAQLLAVTPNVVRVRLHRARLALRSLLDPHLRKEPSA